MLDSIFATKLDMTQAWSNYGKRLVVTRCRVNDNMVVDQKSDNIYEIGYGKKKLKNMSKPLRSKMQKSGFLMGVTKLQGIHQLIIKTQQDEAEVNNTPLKRGDVIKVDQVLEVGDVVKVQGTTKGRGFTGVIKRWGFSGGQRTHGQSDRERAPGSIGAGTDPGRVWLGKKMPGHYGGETKTISGLVVLYINSDTGEVWLSGPVPGYYSSTIRIIKTGQKKEIKLDNVASGIVQAKETEEKTKEEAK
ncbi:50S ribosomal protein L3 [Patescibacteria group bacterium]|nr:50S ribosomal protein L3 [Patescibacteria group bacterium]MBU1885477.1 50S ribosomal protein L3 [Patescibacteria group bacterium]